MAAQNAARCFFPDIRAIFQDGRRLFFFFFFLIRKRSILAVFFSFEKKIQKKNSKFSKKKNRKRPPKRKRAGTLIMYIFLHGLTQTVVNTQVVISKSLGITHVKFTPLSPTCRVQFTGHFLKNLLQIYENSCLDPTRV